MISYTFGVAGTFIFNRSITRSFMVCFSLRDRYCLPLSAKRWADSIIKCFLTTLDGMVFLSIYRISGSTRIISNDTWPPDLTGQPSGLPSGAACSTSLSLSYSCLPERASFISTCQALRPCLIICRTFRRQIRYFLISLYHNYRPE